MRINFAENHDPNQSVDLMRRHLEVAAVRVVSLVGHGHCEVRSATRFINVLASNDPKRSSAQMNESKGLHYSRGWRLEAGSCKVFPERTAVVGNLRQQYFGLIDTDYMHRFARYATHAHEASCSQRRHYSGSGG